MTTPAKEPAPQFFLAKRFHSFRQACRLLLVRAARAYCPFEHLLSSCLTRIVKMAMFSSRFLSACYPRGGIGLAFMSARDDFARNLTIRMDLLGISDSDLARKLNYAPITIGRWKRAQSEPSFADLDKLRTILGLTPQELLAPDATAAELLDADAALAILAAAVARGKSPIK